MRTLATIGALAIVAAVAAAVFFFGGFYSVAGTAEEPALVKWALVQVRTASINRHATDTPPAGLSDPARIAAGAKAYAAAGCVNCHGAPGTDWAKFSEGLRPDPPDLKELVNDRTPAQLFWVVKNGINMTGMPGFALAGANDNDLWAIAAFLKKLPDVSDADYKSWTAPPPAAAAPEPAPVPAPAPPASPNP